MDAERQAEMIEVNVTTLTRLTHMFLPGMIARDRGGVLNVASTAAFQPGPNMAVYYATKAYVLSFTEALSEELADQTEKLRTPLLKSILSRNRAAMQSKDLDDRFSRVFKSLRLLAVGAFALAPLAAVAEPVVTDPASGSQLGGDVLAWRNDGSGVFPSTSPAMHWSADKNILWKTKLPGRSISSPIVVKDRVFTTAEPTDLICVEASDGRIRWQRSHSYRDLFGEEKGGRIESDLQRAVQLQRQIKELKRAANGKSSETELDQQQDQIAKLQEQYDVLTRPYPPVPTGGPGNTTATPVSDGLRVWAVFATGIVSCHTLEGERVWMKFVEAPGDRHSTSPLLVDGTVIVHLKDLVALDADTGKVVWRTVTPSRAGTPVVVQCGSETTIVTPAGAVVRARDGELRSEGLFRLGYCSPISHGNVCYVIERGKVKALRLKQDASDELEVQEMWELRSARDHRLASPLVHDGLLYAATKDGILEVIDAETGERVYRKRLEFEKGRVDPSLALAGGRLYVSSNRGETIVVAPGRDFEELARNRLADFSSSPVFHKDRIYIRTRDHLYAIASRN